MNAMDRGNAHLIPFGDAGHPLAPGNEDFGYREPPANTEAEQSLLGALLVQNDILDRVRGTVRPEHFYEPVHGKLYEHIVQLIDRGQRATPVTLKPFFEHDAALADVGGASYLVRLAGSAVGILNAADYARAILECWMRRKLALIGQQITQAAYDPKVEDTPAQQVEIAQECLFEVLGDRQDAGGFKSRAEIMRVALERAEEASRRQGIIGVETGIAGLDALLGGLENGCLYYLGARPKHGKTRLGAQIGQNVATRYGATVLVQIEMDESQLGQRMLAGLTGVSIDRLRRGQVGASEWPTMYEAVANDTAPFFIDILRYPTVRQIRSRVLAFRRQQDVKLLVIDYLQLIRAADRYRGNRVQEVTEISAELRTFAKELDRPLLVLSQFSRDLAKREDPRPRLTDFRESGAIEQDGFALLGLFNRHAHQPEPPATPDDRADWESVRGQSELYVLAQRQGTTGKVLLRDDAATGRVTDWVAAADAAQPDMLNDDRWERVP